MGTDVGTDVISRMNAIVDSVCNGFRLFTALKIQPKRELLKSVAASISPAYDASLSNKIETRLVENHARAEKDGDESTANAIQHIRLLVVGSGPNIMAIPQVLEGALKSEAVHSERKTTCDGGNPEFEANFNEELVATALDRLLAEYDAKSDTGFRDAMWDVFERTKAASVKPTPLIIGFLVDSLLDIFTRGSGLVRSARGDTDSVNTLPARSVYELQVYLRSWDSNPHLGAGNYGSGNHSAGPSPSELHVKTTNDVKGGDMPKLKATGVFDRATELHLKRWLALHRTFSYMPSRGNGKGDAHTVYKALRDRGAGFDSGCAELLQEALNVYGLGLKVDGCLGRKTGSAIERFVRATLSPSERVPQTSLSEPRFDATMPSSKALASLWDYVDRFYDGKFPYCDEAAVAGAPGAGQTPAAFDGARAAAAERNFLSLRNLGKRHRGSASDRSLRHACLNTLCILAADTTRECAEVFDRHFERTVAALGGSRASHAAYVVAVAYHARRDDMNEMLRVYDEMKSHGIEPESNLIHDMLGRVVVNCPEPSAFERLVDDLRALSQYPLVEHCEAAKRQYAGHDKTVKLIKCTIEESNRRRTERSLDAAAILSRSRSKRGSTSQAMSMGQRRNSSKPRKVSFVPPGRGSTLGSAGVKRASSK